MSDMSDSLLYERSSVESYEVPEDAPEGLRRAVELFLFHEAELLDGYQFKQWLNLITPDIDYRIPIRTTINDHEFEKAFSDRAFHMVEDYGSLAARMARLMDSTAWSERPPTRARRHISNVRVGSPSNDLIKVRSYLLFFWGRDKDSVIVSAERRDLLQSIRGKLYLAKRMVLLDHVSLPVANLSVVL